MDESVIAACQQGDRDAFRFLFETYQDRVYALAFYACRGDAAAAQDVTQQVFLKLMTRIGQYRGEARFTTWLYRLVSNVCLDQRRQETRFVPLEAPAPVPPLTDATTQETHLARRRLADAVRAAIMDLKPKLRLTILLKYREDLSYEEMAQALGCAPGTVASRLNRAHRHLARRLRHLRGALTPEG